MQSLPNIFSNIFYCYLYSFQYQLYTAIIFHLNWYYRLFLDLEKLLIEYGIVPTGQVTLLIIFYQYIVPKEQESGVELFLQFLY